jgi:hypothetical protein
MSIEDLFNKHHNEYLKFDRVSDKKSIRPDLHVFIILDSLAVDECDIVSSADHGEIWLSFKEDNFNLLTEEIIVDLIRCGVHYDSEFDCLSMFT